MSEDNNNNSGPDTVDSTPDNVVNINDYRNSKATEAGKGKNRPRLNIDDQCKNLETAFTKDSENRIFLKAKKLAERQRDFPNQRMDEDTWEKLYKICIDPKYHGNKEGKKQLERYLDCLLMGKFPKKAEGSLRILECARSGNPEQQAFAREELRILSSGAEDKISPKSRVEKTGKAISVFNYYKILNTLDDLGKAEKEAEEGRRRRIQSLGEESRNSLDRITSSTSLNYRGEIDPEVQQRILEFENKSKAIFGRIRAFERQIKEEESQNPKNLDKISGLKAMIENCDREIDQLRAEYEKAHLQEREFLAREKSRFEGIKDLSSIIGIDLLRCKTIQTDLGNLEVDKIEFLDEKDARFGYSKDDQSKLTASEKEAITNCGGSMKITYRDQDNNIQRRVSISEFLDQMRFINAREEIESLEEMVLKNPNLNFIQPKVNSKFKSSLETSDPQEFKITKIENGRIYLDQEVLYLNENRFRDSYFGAVGRQRRKTTRSPHEGMTFGEFSTFIQQNFYTQELKSENLELEMEEAVHGIAAWQTHERATTCPNSPPKQYNAFQLPNAGETAEIVYKNDLGHSCVGTLSRTEDGGYYLSKYDDGFEGYGFRDLVHLGVPPHLLANKFDRNTRKNYLRRGGKIEKFQREIAPEELLNLIKQQNIFKLRNVPSYSYPIADVAQPTAPQWDLRRNDQSGDGLYQQVGNKFNGQNQTNGQNTPTDGNSSSSGSSPGNGNSQNVNNSPTSNSNNDGGGTDGPGGNDGDGASEDGENEDPKNDDDKKNKFQPNLGSIYKLEDEVVSYDQVRKVGGMDFQSSNFLLDKWRETRFLSGSDIWELGKSWYEYYNRRFERRQKERYTDPFKDVSYFGPEMRRVNQAQENERVQEFQGTLEQEDIYVIQERLRETSDKDEMKAAFIVLSGKGQLRWDDVAMWKNLNTWVDSSVQIPIPVDGDPFRIDEKTGLTGFDYLKGAIDSVWGGSTYDGWANQNKSNMDSNVKSFYQKGIELEAKEGGHEMELGKLLAQHKRGEYVDPHEYEGLIMQAIEHGKSSAHAKLYYMVQGVGCVNQYGRTILAPDRIAHINGNHLGKFPMLEFMCTSVKRDTGIKHKLGFEDYKNWAKLFDDGNPSNIYPTHAVDRFLWEVVVTSKQNRTRVNKAIQNGAFDHDDMPIIGPVMTYQVMKDALQSAGGGSKRNLTIEGYKNIWGGFSQYFKTQAKKGDAEGIKEALGSYMIYYGSMTERYKKGDDRYQRLDDENMTWSVAAGAPNVHDKQIKAMMKEIGDYYANHTDDKIRFDELQTSINKIMDTDPKTVNMNSKAGREKADELTQLIDDFPNVVAKAFKKDGGEGFKKIAAKHYNQLEGISYQTAIEGAAERKAKLAQYAGRGANDAAA